MKNKALLSFAMAALIAAGGSAGFAAESAKPAFSAAAAAAPQNTVLNISCARSFVDTAEIGILQRRADGFCVIRQMITGNPAEYTLRDIDL